MIFFIFIDYIEEVCGLGEYKYDDLVLVVAKSWSQGLDIVESLFHINGLGSNPDGIV